MELGFRKFQLGFQKSKQGFQKSISNIVKLLKMSTVQGHDLVGGFMNWWSGELFFGRQSPCRVWSSEKKLNDKNGLKRQIFNIALAKKFRSLFKICIKIDQKVTVAI